MVENEFAVRFAGQDLARLREFAQEQGVSVEQAVSDIMTASIQEHIAVLTGGKAHMRGVRGVIVPFPVRRPAVA